MTKKEPCTHRVTIRTTVGGDINKTLRTEVRDMTETEYHRFLASFSRKSHHTQPTEGLSNDETYR